MKINKQAGMTGIGWAIILFLIGFFVYLGFKIVPIQIEAYKVRSALERLNEIPHVTKMSKKEIVRKLFNQFNIEDITAVKAEDINFLKEKGVLTVTIEYEQRKLLIKPYDIVGVFKEKVRIVEH